MNFPTLITIPDIEKMIDYLSRKISGDTIKNTRDTIGSVANEYKLPNYINIGVIKKEGDKIILGNNGSKLNSSTDPQEKKRVYSDIIRNIDDYKKIIEWIHYQEKSELILPDIGRQWKDIDNDIKNLSERQAKETII